MVVLVDTSVWISLYRKENAEIGQRMLSLVSDNQAALCGQVWVEYLGGFRKEPDRREHERSLGKFPFLETTRTAYERAAALLAFHPRLGPGDAIIAATAIDSRSPLFTLDRDFFRLASEGLELYR
ncbi:MAG: PIN domain-containing protein [Deltaproteobacteria bacterium]|nr:PIN domain-containing protein [Deltaproteobacteria bacterium]